MHELAVDVMQLLAPCGVDAGFYEPQGSAVANGIQMAQQGVNRRCPRRPWPIDDPVEQIGARLLGETDRARRRLEGGVAGSRPGRLEAALV
jgi:hypothetical protein